MRLFYILLIFSASILGCSGTEEEINTNPAPNNSYDGPGGVYYNDDLVSTPNTTSAISITTYHTLLDTLYSNEDLDYKIGAFVDEGDSALINWTIKGNSSFQRSFLKYWDQAKQKWGTINTAKLASNSNGEVNIKTAVSFRKNAKTYTRESTIKFINSIKKVDFLGVNFGMNRSEVKDAEILRTKSRIDQWQEYSPIFSMKLGTHYYTNISSTATNTFYEFKDNKLISISEVDPFSNSSTNFNDVAKRFSFKGSELKFPTTWVKGNIRFTIQEKEFDTAVGKQTYKCITYEKI